MKKALCFFFLAAIACLASCRKKYICVLPNNDTVTVVRERFDNPITTREFVVSKWKDSDEWIISEDDSHSVPRSRTKIDTLVDDEQYLVTWAKLLY